MLNDAHGKIKTEAFAGAWVKTPERFVIAIGTFEIDEAIGRVPSHVIHRGSEIAKERRCFLGGDVVEEETHVIALWVLTSFHFTADAVEGRWRSLKEHLLIVGTIAGTAQPRLVNKQRVNAPGGQIHLVDIGIAEGLFGQFHPALHQ